MNSLPLWVRIVGGLGVLWYVNGTIGYLGSLGLTPEELETLPAASREALRLRPVWLTPVALISLGAGLLGAIGLVIGRRWSAPSFLVALATNLPYAYSALVIADAYRLFGIGSVVIQSVTLGVCAGFAWLAHHGRRRGWLI